MIVAAAVCPHPPLLFRELTGLEDVAADLRGACLEAIAALRGVDVIVLVGGARAAGSWGSDERFDVTKFGRTQARPSERSDLPLSLGIGARLLDEAGWTGPRELIAVARDASAADLGVVASGLAARPERVGLLVMGEGSTRRGQSAPGYIDSRAPVFDRRIGAALRQGDAAVLRDLDVELADELMVLGRSSFQLLGHAAPDGAAATVLYEKDPFGVMYFVAVWQLGCP